MMKVLFRAGILLAGIFLAFGITKWLLKWLFEKCSSLHSGWRRSQLWFTSFTQS